MSYQKYLQEVNLEKQFCPCSQQEHIVIYEDEDAQITIAKPQKIITNDNLLDIWAYAWEKKNIHGNCYWIKQESWTLGCFLSANSFQKVILRMAWDKLKALGLIPEEGAKIENG